MPQRIENIIKGVVEGMGGSYEFTYLRGYSPTGPPFWRVIGAGT